jgi:hypothetical protein
MIMLGIKLIFNIQLIFLRLSIIESYLADQLFPMERATLAQQGFSGR